MPVLGKIAHCGIAVSPAKSVLSDTLANVSLQVLQALITLRTKLLASFVMDLRNRLLYIRLLCPSMIVAVPGLGNSFEFKYLYNFSFSKAWIIDPILYTEAHPASKESVDYLKNPKYINGRED